MRVHDFLIAKFIVVAGVFTVLLVLKVLLTVVAIREGMY